MSGDAKRPSSQRAKSPPHSAAGSDTPRPIHETHSSPRATKTPGQISQNFGRYRIIRRLGKGGMGTVFLAEDTQLHREVALKIPHFETDDNQELLERFYREARAAATLNHPNLCPIHDVGEIDGVHYLTMAYIEGQSLSDLVRPGAPLAAEDAVAIVHKLALGMAEAHEKGIVHRDLKPSNICMNQRGEPVVMDFGLARRKNSGDARLTKSGAVIGTPAYMPPEQIKGDFDAIGPCCDIYSLGVILYELLTGEIPFDGPIAAVLGQVLTQEPPPPSKFRPDLDPRLEAVCLKMMAKDISDRHQSMADVASDLALSPQAALDAKSKNTPAPGRQKESAKTKTDAKSTQHMHELDKRKKQIESLLEQCEYAPAIDLLEKMVAIKSSKLAKYSRWAQQQLPKAKRGPEEMRESSAAMQRTAAELFGRYDYEQAVELLQQVPKKYRSPETKKLLRECLDLQEEIVVLQEDIEQAEAINRFDDLLPTVKRLLEIKPNDRRAKRLLKELKTYGKGGNMRFGGRRDQRFDAAGSTFSPAKAVLFVVIPLVLFGVVSWATVVYIGSNNQTNENGNPSAKNPVDDSGDTSNLVADGNTAVDQPPGIEEAKYTTTPQGSLKIYLDYPADWRADDSRPIVILFHAGAWAGGSPVDVKPYTTFFLQKGYITARPEYRVAERHGTGIKEAAEDAKQVVRWVRQNAAKLTVDPSRIIVFGHRVGAHLAACAGTDTPGGDADSSTTSSRPNGMILFSPWVDLKYKPDLATRRGLDQAAATALSPTRHIDRRTPPSIIITASKSKATPVEMVNEFVTEAKRNSVSVEVVMVDVAQPLMPGLWTPNTLRRMEEFLNALKSGKSPTSSETTETATPRLVDVTKIPSTAQVAAYPDLRFFKGQWFCAFREGSSVNSSDGVIRVAKSPKAALWKSCSTISLNGVDLRDPKISETPDNRLMLTCIASRRTPGRLAEIQSYVTFSSDGITWAPLQEIPVGEQHWYWRPVWHDGVCYCITYKIASKTRRAMSLFSSEDGRDYRIVNLQLYSTMLPSEAAMVFLEDDRAICVVRRDGGDKKAVIGKARPPYTDWTWKDLDRSIAGPCLQQLADRRIIVSGRFSEPSTHTGLCWLNVDDGTTEEFLSLPSGGYTGHPSIQVRDNELFVAYFSSHEGATGNYVARLALDTSTDTTFELFNGRDLSGWSVGYLRYTKDKSPKRWVIDKTAEVLRSVGGDQDHLITDDEFENYTLDLEWRFTRSYKSGPNGTGVIVHSPGTSTELDPDGFEVDLRFAEISALIETRSKIMKSGGQGMMGTGCIIAYGESITNHSGSANGLVGENNRRHLDWLEPPKIASIYSWNRLSITAVDDQLLVRINGTLVNKAWNLSRRKGRICLRSQNAAVEFRNITLRQHSN